MLLGSVAGLCALLSCVYASVIVYTKAIPHAIMAEFADMPADFGPELGAEGVRGLLALAVPRDACSNVTQPPPVADNFTHKWVLLVARAHDACTFERQVRNAQAAGYDAAIVHNVNSSDLEVMTAMDPDGIDIPAVFVSDSAGFKLAAEFLYTSGFYVMVNGELPFDINTHLLLPFAVVVAVCLLVILVFMVVKCIKDRRRARRHRLPRRALDKILTWQYSKGDPYDTCAICLDDYRCGERLRVLGCAHAYHAACLDPWLTQNRRVCPVCKRRVLVAGDPAPAASDSDTDDDTTPLVRRAAPATQGGTFTSGTEHPFSLATRFVAALRARQYGAVPQEQPSSDEERAQHADDVNGNSATTPSGRSARRARPHGPRPRQPRPHRPRPAPDTHSERGEIGVAALPAPASVSL